MKKLICLVAMAFIFILGTREVFALEMPSQPSFPGTPTIPPTPTVPPTPVFPPCPGGCETDDPTSTPTATATATPTATDSSDQSEESSTGGAPFNFGGPPAPGSASGEVLGMAGTGVFEETLFNAVFSLGSILTALGLRRRTDTVK